jgi:FkbM family methyltransferase
MPSVIAALRPWVSKSPGLSRLYRVVRDELQSRRAPVATPLGFKFVGPKQMAAGAFEPVETHPVASLAPCFTTLINVGANNGYYCCLALQAGKRVVAFEPMALNQRALYRNVRVNGWADRFECHPIALSDRTGLMDIYGGGTGASLIAGWSGQTYATTVPVSTLDTVLGARFDAEPRLIIIDVEGAELDVLKGAQGSLGAATRPIWLVEIEMMNHQPTGARHNPDFIAVFRLFHDFGYAALSATSPPRPVTITALEESVRSGVRMFDTCNFLFVEASRLGEITALIGAPPA